MFEGANTLVIGDELINHTVGNDFGANESSVWVVDLVELVERLVLWSHVLTVISNVTKLSNGGSVSRVSGETSKISLNRNSVVGLLEQSNGTVNLVLAGGLENTGGESILKDFFCHLVVRVVVSRKFGSTLLGHSLLFGGGLLRSGSSLRFGSWLS